jgi:hypothetical protein
VKNKKEYAPTVIRKKYTNERKSPSEISSLKDTYKKRWATSLNTGDAIKINGPCELFIRRSTAHQTDLVFFLEENVFVEKLNTDKNE